MLVPYWIECIDAPGVGITASSEADALALLGKAFGSERRPENITVLRSVSELDQNHVVPNKGNWLKRGIWYPLGYAKMGEF
jgi:hypothetical protein